MNENPPRPQRDLVDWIGTGANVYTAVKVREIAGYLERAEDRVRAQEESLRRHSEDECMAATKFSLYPKHLPDTHLGYVWAVIFRHTLSKETSGSGRRDTYKDGIEIKLDYDYHYSDGVDNNWYPWGKSVFGSDFVHTSPIREFAEYFIFRTRALFFLNELTESAITQDLVTRRKSAVYRLSQMSEVNPSTAFANLFFSVVSLGVVYTWDTPLVKAVATVVAGISFLAFLVCATRNSALKRKVQLAQVKASKTESNYVNGVLNLVGCPKAIRVFMANEMMAHDARRPCDSMIYAFLLNPYTLHECFDKKFDKNSLKKFLTESDQKWADFLRRCGIRPLGDASNDPLRDMSAIECFGRQKMRPM